MDMPKLAAFDFPVEFEAASFTLIVEKNGSDPQRYAYLVQGWRPMLEAVARENFRMPPERNDEATWMEGCVEELLEVFGNLDCWEQATTSDFKPFRCVWQTGPGITGNGAPLRRIEVVRLFENDLERHLLQFGFPGGLRPGEADDEDEDAVNNLSASPFSARKMLGVFLGELPAPIGETQRWGGYKDEAVAMFLTDLKTFLDSNPGWTEMLLLRAARADHRILARVRSGAGFRIRSIEDVAETMNRIERGEIDLASIQQEQRDSRRKGGSGAETSSDGPSVSFARGRDLYQGAPSTGLTDDDDGRRH